MKSEKRAPRKGRASEIPLTLQDFGSTKPSDFQAIEASEYLKNTTLWKGLSQFLLAKGESDVTVIVDRETAHD